MQKTIAEINLKAIKDNAKFFKTRTGKKLFAVVKANAYGHGAVEVVGALSSEVDGFAVALVEEGMEIRVAACGKDILVFTPPTSREDCLAILESGMIACVGDLRSARLVAKTATERNLRARVHLKVNTGMNRYGMNGSMLGKVCKFFAGQKNVSVEGLFSHLYTTNREICESQRELFLRFATIGKRYFPNLSLHLSATHGALLGDGFSFDCVRIGIGLYGYAPCGERLPIKKAMRVFAPVQTSRKFSFGGVGYGENASIEKGQNVSVVRFGYADGFLRKKENGTEGGENVGNLCMDVCFKKGKRGVGRLVPVMTDAEETAKETGTIAYEVLCAATRRAERIYVYE